MKTSDGPVPNSAPIDWRTLGAVSPVKNQGTCGADWAFSTTGVMEGAHQIASSLAVMSFSEQQLVDCCNGDYGNNGCQPGGQVANAYKYLTTSLL